MLLIAGIDEIDGLKPASSLHKKTPDTNTSLLSSQASRLGFDLMNAE
jgi:hypothetical protein